MTTVHLDTDIGDDIDDAFCLALLLKSPELSVKSISTVLNDTAHRADMCRDLCSAAGCEPVTVAGSRSVISRRQKLYAMTRPPHHGALQRSTLQADIAGTLLTLAVARKTADVLLTIGPMTNLALSLVADPDVTRFPRYIAMAGEVQIAQHAEWNIRIDPEAAAVVCSSGVKIDFIPFKIGIDTKLSTEEMAELDRAQSPVARVLNAFRKEFWTTCPKQEMFDPMTVVALLHEEWFTWKQGTMIVETRGEETYGQTNFRYDPSGPHRVAVAVDVERAKRWMLDRLCN